MSVTTVYATEGGFNNNVSGNYNWSTEGLCLSEISSSGATLENRGDFVFDTNGVIPETDIIDSVVLRLYCPSWFIDDYVYYGGGWSVHASSVDNLADAFAFAWDALFSFEHYVGVLDSWGTYNEWDITNSYYGSEYPIGINRTGYTNARVRAMIVEGGSPVGYHVSASFALESCRLIITHHAAGWGNKIYGIANVNIGKIMAILKANTKKVYGV